MGREDVELVRGMVETFASGGMDALTPYFDDDVEWRAIEGAPDDVGEIRGAEAVRSYAEEFAGAFDGFTLSLREVQDLGGGVVVALQHLAGQAKLSGAKAEFDYAVVYWIRDGKIVRGREYMSVDEALDAARPSS